MGKTHGALGQMLMLGWKAAGSLPGPVGVSFVTKGLVRMLELADVKYSERPWRPAMLYVGTWKGSKNSSPAWPSTSEAGFPTHTTRPVTESEPLPGTTSTTWPGVSEMLASILAPYAETSRVTASHSSHFLSVSINMIKAIFAILRLDRRGTGWAKEATVPADYTHRR